MKILVIGLDKKILDKNSAVAQRAIAYGSLLEEYFVLVPGRQETIKLSDKVTIQGVDGGNKIVTLFKIYKFLNKKLAESKYNLVSIQDVYYLAGVAVILAKKFQIKIEIQIHGLEKFSSLRKKIARYNLTRADKVRTVSLRMKNYLVDNFKLDPIKVYIAPVAIYKDKILADKSSVNLKARYPDNFIFLTVGRLVPIKNVALQIGCMAGLDPNLKVRLIIVGDGPEKARLRALAQKLNVEDRIEFSGWTDNLAGYYRSADCLLLSSDSEGYGMVIAEAILSALPIIMTDVGAAGELVKNDFNGLVVPVDNAKALSQAMEKVINNRELLYKFSTNTINMQTKILDQTALVQLVVDNWKR